MRGIEPGWHKGLCSISYQDIHVRDHHKTPQIQVKEVIFLKGEKNIIIQNRKASYKFKHKVVTSG